MTCEGRDKYALTPKGILFEKYGDKTANEIMDLLELQAMRSCKKAADAVPAIIFDCYHGRFDSVTWTIDKLKKKAKRK